MTWSKLKSTRSGAGPNALSDAVEPNDCREPHDGAAPAGMGIATGGMNSGALGGGVWGGSTPIEAHPRHPSIHPPDV
eukprot:CAMPEP_0174703024 /NCGR_PEP_ID=MMETSP1094-20130205/7122_1 /TAXON_ID=156173 /ORGANISM="Chrysochromulina brevifilum, Strain UTEX LB 985" /LENGTH=76 /DNA_ID=CAMNT_0015900889 /DNA_START=145 /DNA_END=376 /DNA_ORIENTATION=+